MTFSIPIGQGATPSFIRGKYACRHGLIAGATGSGKTYTIAALAERFSAIGVPSLVVDVKGDLAGLSRSTRSSFIRPGENFTLSVDALSPDLMSRALNLTDAQSGALEVGYALAKADRLPLATLADFRALLTRLATQHKAISRRFGLVTPSSVAVIQRALIRVEAEGSNLFAKSTFDVANLLETGLVSILDAQRLSQSPTLYGAALLFILSDLYARLPEVGDLDRPRLVLFLDEAHLLFADAPPALIQRVERIVRLIRSKSVGVFFATQSPADIPAAILAQLGTRIQHGLRGATAADLRGIRAAVETMPQRPGFDAFEAIGRLGVGMALVSTLDDTGRPTPVDMVRVKGSIAPLGPVGPTPVEAASSAAVPSLNRTTDAWLGLAAVACAACAVSMIGFWTICFVW